MKMKISFFFARTNYDYAEPVAVASSIFLAIVLPRFLSVSLSLFLSFLFQIIFLRVSARTNAARLAHRYLSGLWKQLHIVPRTVRSRWKGKGVEVEVKVVHDFACQACISNIKNEGVDLCRRANELSWVATYNSKRNKTEEKCSANQLVFLTSPPLLFTVLLPSDFTVKLLVAFCSHDVCLFHFVDWLHCCTSYANLEWSLPCACVLIFFFLFLPYFAFFICFIFFFFIYSSIFNNSSYSFFNL